MIHALIDMNSNYYFNCARDIMTHLLHSVRLNDTGIMKAPIQFHLIALIDAVCYEDRCAHVDPLVLVYAMEAVLDQPMDAPASMYMPRMCGCMSMHDDIYAAERMFLRKCTQGIHKNKVSEDLSRRKHEAYMLNMSYMKKHTKYAQAEYKTNLLHITQPVTKYTPRILSSITMPNTHNLARKVRKLALLLTDVTPLTMTDTQARTIINTITSIHVMWTYKRMHIHNANRNYIGTTVGKALDAVIHSPCSMCIQHLSVLDMALIARNAGKNGSLRRFFEPDTSHDIFALWHQNSCVRIKMLELFAHDDNLDHGDYADVDSLVMIHIIDHVINFTPLLHTHTDHTLQIHDL